LFLKARFFARSKMQSFKHHFGNNPMQSINRVLAGGSFLFSMGKDYLRVLQKEKAKYGIQDSSVFSRFFNDIGLTSLAIS